tara:strand:+ start:514 stop:1335 length:822 start_codon:yes stop_codon:yes gene_type:complete
MKRNNEERTKTRRSQAASVDPSTVLNFVTPTEFVELPSKGIGYPEGHILRDKEMIEIRFMTTKDEDTLSSRSLLKKGLALDRLIDNLLVEKEIKARDILVGDRNAIIIAARSSAYGHIYETKVQCPSCDHKQKMSFDLSNPEITDPEINEEIEEMENGNYMYVTSQSKIKVEMRLLNGHDENVIFKALNNKNEEAALSTQMTLFISSVNGHNHPNIVKHFVENVPAFEAREIRKIFSNLTSAIQIKEIFECESCSFEQEMEVPFNTDFFWPDR